MAGHVPAIHVFVLERGKTWMPGTGPGMTSLEHATWHPYSRVPITAS